MWHLSAASCPLFNTSLTYIIGCYGNVAYSRFTSSSMCSTNFSIQPFPQYFFNGSGTSPWAKVLCTRHPYGTYVFYLFRIWCLAFVLSAFIVFILSLYHPSTGFKILSKSAYSINGTLNWYCPSWNFNHFFFHWAYWPWRDHCCCSTHSAYLLLTLYKNCWVSSCSSDTCAFFRLTLLRTWIYSWLQYNTCFHHPVLSIS